MEIFVIVGGFGYIMDYKLYRCKFIRETKEYIISKDVFSEDTYYIKKSPETSTFKVGFDNSFYAIKKSKGVLFKRNILEVVDYNEIIKKGTVGLAN